MRLLLTRHGEMEPMVETKGVPSHGITERGRLQSTLLATSFANNGVSIDEIHSGPAKRHQETAEQIAETIAGMTGDRPEITEHAALADVDWGDKAVDAFLERGSPSPPWVIEEWMTGNIEIRENLSHVRERVLETRDHILDAHGPDDTVLVTTSAINIYLLVLNALDIEPGAVVLNVNNVSLFELQYEGGTEALLQMNARTHLPERLVTDTWQR